MTIVIGTDVVVVSYGFARSHFGDAVRAAGQRIFLNNLPFTIAGVTPPGFYGVDSGSAPEFYLPLRADVALDPARGGKASEARYLDGHYYWIEIMGRLRPGVAVKQAQAHVAPVFQNWVASTAENNGQHANLPQFLLSYGARGVDRLRRNFEEPLVILMGMVTLILVIACANIANLLLARATTRRREMAVRLSIGAGRSRVIRQLLSESVLLASIGGFGGVLLAYWSVPILRAMLTSGSSFVLRAELNVHVLAATAALTMITGVLFGLAPALQATRVDTMPVLKELRAAGPRGRLRVGLGQILVIAQIAISLLLVAVAGLFVRTLSKLQSVDVGFTRENVLVFQSNAQQAGHQPGELLSFYRGLEHRFSAIPGVISVAEADSPLIGDGAWGWAVVPVGKPKPEHAPSGHGSFGGWENTHTLQVDAHFFSTMEIPLIAGRGFTERDRAGSAPVAIVNEAWVKANPPGRNAVGERVVSFGLDDKPVQMDVIGVAKNAMYNRIEENFPATVYLPLGQNLGPRVEALTFFLRTSGDPLKCTSAVREIVHETDTRIPVTNIATQEQRIEKEIGDEILFARLSAGFALLALSISCVGLYATLYGVKAGDPASMVTAVIAIVIAVLVAGYVPARRASRIDPLVARRMRRLRFRRWIGSIRCFRCRLADWNGTALNIDAMAPCRCTRRWM